MIRFKTPTFWTRKGDQSGATAVEFALIGGIFITLVMGVIEFAMILYTYSQAGAAARDVARRYATSRITTTTAATTAVKAQLPSWVQNWVTVNVAQTSAATPSTNQITVTVSFPASKATATTYLSFAYGSMTLQASATMQQEI